MNHMKENESMAKVGKLKHPHRRRAARSALHEYVEFVVIQ